MKIVVDTNILISAAYFGGLPKELIYLIANGKLKAFANIDIINEYKSTLLRFPDDNVNKTYLKLLNVFNLINTHTELEICRDPKDNMFINCAIDAKAVYIVSGDKDLLSLEKVENVLIVTVKDFLKAYNMQKYN